ncbi:Cysteine desulfurase, mitosomal [Tritrichomonas foetus]|uniref:cysteine desulfurase n=2 Tax=Tritrichomonas TaxID=5723 RepID=A0A1J4JP76_9EUKA|nr:putative cysteine desulphurase [Tritrichomonas foetus]OHS99315.1 Cysteine desulfurase, mitosomal [Tritrichomonas foetus]|eukprot:OHS99315.1 Cysteine desulfurase, mitosomal [Tritrichomonas foetus]
MLGSIARRNYFKGHYFDTQATSKLEPRVLDAMLPFETFAHGNAHSGHGFGKEAEKAAETARKQIADLINANAKDIIFTSGATESNNLAIKGSMAFLKSKGKKHLIVSQIEHKCVLESARYLERNGFDVTYLKVQKDGLVLPSDLEKAIRKDTGLVSILTVNNEIGVLQPIPKLANICKKHGVWMHTDAAQAAGRIEINVKKSGVNLMSLSAHKMHGPKGIGALYMGNKPRVRIVPIINGGGQERGMRSGTLAVPLAVGFGKAAEIAQNEMKWDSPYIESLGKYLIEKVRAEIPEVIVNGSEESRWFGCVNISFDCVEGESLMAKVPEYAVSSGSACTSASLEPSYVLKAIGVGDENAHTSLRIGISKFTKKSEIDSFVSKLKTAVLYLRDLSPLWEMKQAGIDLSTVQWID